MASLILIASSFAYWIVYQSRKATLHSKGAEDWNYQVNFPRAEVAQIQDTSKSMTSLWSLSRRFWCDIRKVEFLISFSAAIINLFCHKIRIIILEEHFINLNSVVPGSQGTLAIAIVLDQDQISLPQLTPFCSWHAWANYNKEIWSQLDTIAIEVNCDQALL